MKQEYSQLLLKRNLSEENIIVNFPLTLAASSMDKVTFLMQEIGDQIIHFVVELNSHIDLELFEESIKQAIMMENTGELIIVVGSGSPECVLKLEHEIKRDRKYVVKYHDLLGGSGINYTFRLLQAKIPVFPIISIGKDETGEKK